MEIEERDLGNQKRIHSTDEDGDYTISVSGIEDGNVYICIERDYGEVYITPSIEEFKALRDLLNDYIEKNK